MKTIGCIGCGGVGKTTLSAAIAWACAQQWGKTALVTVDPSKRLLSTLGLEPDVATPQPWSPTHKIHVDVISPSVRATFADLVDEHVPRETRARLEENKIYQSFVSGLAGAHEYATVDVVARLARNSEYQALVIDTPPGESLSGFLDAPARIDGFLNQKAARVLLKGQGGMGWLAPLARKGLSLLAGRGTLDAVSDFLVALEGIFETIQQEANTVARLYRNRETKWVSVLRPSPLHATRWRETMDAIESRGILSETCVINGVRPWSDTATAETVEAASSHCHTADREEAVAVMHEQLRRAQRESTWLTQFEKQNAELAITSTPDLGVVVHETDALRRLKDCVMGALPGND